MKGFEYIKSTEEYLNYLQTHLENVEDAYDEFLKTCSDLLSDEQLKLLDQEVNNHDVSKFSKEEFVQYRDHFYPTSTNTGFDNSIKKDFQDAWENHKRLNPHHWENWSKLIYKNDNWKIHCAHMVIDWLAMSYQFGDTPREYYEKNEEEIKIPNYAVDFLYDVFDALEAG